MSETPKFTVVDRRKIKASEEQGSQQQPATQPEAPPAPPEPGAGPRLVVNEAKSRTEQESAAEQEPQTAGEMENGLPAAPTAEESREQKMAYDASAQRLEDLVRAQNPAMGEQPPLGFEHLVQQFYLSAMIQMGAGTQEGERQRVDILGARATIDLLGVLEEKTRGNLNEAEDRMLQAALFEARMAFLELTSMITLKGAPPPPGVR
ncbi:MAG: DUF1844 domain-containing protein [Terracidiphilus sp.]